MHLEHYKQFNFDYDRKALLDLYYEYIYEFPSERNIRSPFKALSENIDLTSHATVSKIFDQVPAIPRKPYFSTLCEITKSVRYHCNPRNNGTIFFPVSGSLDVTFYSFNPPLDSSGRPTFSPMPEDRPILTAEEQADLDSSVFETVSLDNGPIAINGLKLHSYQPTSLEPPVIFVLKIPMEVNWLDVITSIGK
jgi:hypothetical protein